MIACLAMLMSLPAGAERVEFSGLSESQVLNARAFVTLANADCDTPQWQLERLALKAPQEITAALEALGYYQSSVTTDGLDLSDECLRILFAVTPGTRTRYEQVNIEILGEARDDALIQQVLATRAPRVNDPLHHGKYEQFKRALLDAAAEHGYFEAALEEHSVVVDASNDAARLTVRLASGPRYRFGAVEYRNNYLDADLLANFTPIRSGAPFDSQQVAATHRYMLDSGYYSEVRVDADPARAENLHVPVTVIVTPASKRVYAGGVGFSTDLGPRFRMNYQQRRINSRGHNFEGRLLVSPRQSQLSGEYRIPQGDDRRDMLSLRGGIEREDTDTSKSDAIRLAVRQVRALDNGWLRTYYIEALQQNFVIGDQDDSSRLLIPGVSFWRSSGGSVSRPLSGQRLSLDVRGASAALGSDTSFVRVLAEGKRIVSFNPRLRMLTRLTLGTTARDQLSELPPSERFFAGGDRSVRGYDFESLGPTDDDGDVIGGSHLIAGSVELEYALNARWALALFVDSGSAFSSSQPEFSTGVGVGVRRLTPLGPLRIDFAHPLDDDRSLRLHISIGSDL